MSSVRQIIARLTRARLAQRASLTKRLIPGQWWNPILPAAVVSTHAPLLDSTDIEDLSRRAQAFPSRIAQNPFAKPIAQRQLGDRYSVYKGTGLDYEESRAYQMGDDVRLMNWRLTARSGAPHIKEFREDRRPSVFIAVDRRSTMRFGTRVRLKATQAARIAALLAFTYRQLNMPLAGVSLQTAPQWIPPSCDDGGIFDFINTVAKPCPPVHEFSAEPGMTSLLKSLLALLDSGSIVYLISDFNDLEEQSRSLLMQLGADHEVSAIHIVDPAEATLPSAGQLRVSGLRGAQAVVIDTNDPGTAKEFQNSAFRYLHWREKMFTDLNIAYLRVMSNNDDIDHVLKLVS